MCEVVGELGGLAGIEFAGKVDTDAVLVNLKSARFVDRFVDVADAMEAAVFNRVVAPTVETDDVELAVFGVEGTPHGSGNEFAFKRDDGALRSGTFIVAEDEVVETGPVADTDVVAFEGSPFVAGDLDHSAG